MIGRTISHYTILEKLGEGGMGVVYRAHDTTLDRDVALKFLPHYLTSDPSEKERFYHEARAASALNHPNITTIYEISEYEDPSGGGNRLFIAMEYVEGKTLKQLVQSEPLPMKKALDISLQVCEGLSAAHEKGIVHRDIKSENMLLTPKGQVKIMDFGLAKVKGATKLTKTGSTLGTAAYMSPEQAQGEEVDCRSDIFSFGVVLYELLTGKLPFKGEHQAALLYSIISDEPPPLARFNEKVSPEIERIVSKALAKDREERYQHADEMLADLRRQRKSIEYAKTAFVKAAEGFEPPPAGSGRRRKSWYVFAGIAAVVLIVLAVLYDPFGLKKSGPAATAKERSVAVLPFTNIGGSKEDEFFCDGMTDDILTQISKIADLSVISRNSIMRYKGSEKSVAQIGAELGAGKILSGTIRRSGNRVRIDAQLVDAETDRQVWAENYDREMKDIFDIQSDVARSIASALRITLSSTEKVQLEKKPTTNMDAYSYCVKGREYYYRYTADDLKMAETLFKKAIALDPNYAAAFAGLSDVYSTGTTVFKTWEYSWLDTAVILSKSAVALDPGCAEAHKALGLAYESREWNTKAIEETRKAIGINPNYGPAIANLGDELLKTGHVLEGMQWRLRATRLDPLMAWRYAANAIVYVFLCDDENAEKQFRRARELQPDLSLTLGWMAYWYADQGKLREAFDAVEEQLHLDRDTVLYYTCLEFLYVVYAKDFTKASFYLDLVKKRMHPDELFAMPGRLGVYPDPQGLLEMREGKRELAEEHLRKQAQFFEKSIQDGDEGIFSAYNVAVCDAVLGRKDDAYHWLKIALSKDVLSPRQLALDPWLDDLRNDTEFKEMMRDYKSRIDLLRQQVRGLDTL